MSNTLKLDPQHFEAGMAKAMKDLRFHDRIQSRPGRQLVNVAKVGRNDPCVCGSGRKFKHCCMDR